MQCIRQILHVPLVKEFPEIHLESTASASRCLPNFPFFQIFHYILNAISQPLYAICSIQLTLSSLIYHPQALGEETISNCLIAWTSPMQSYFHFHGSIRPRQRLVSACACGLWTANFHDILLTTLVGANRTNCSALLSLLKILHFLLSFSPPPPPGPCAKKNARSDRKFMCNCTDISKMRVLQRNRVAKRINFVIRRIHTTTTDLWASVETELQ